ncbi:MAG: DUF4192 domain-containing protein [Pseudonocardia sp.]
MQNKTTAIRIGDLGESVAAVPVLLGFHPARSLTVLLLTKRQVALTVRTDLPPATESAQRYAGQLVDSLTARGGVDADRAVLIVVDQQRHADLVTHVAQALARLGITVNSTMWAEGTRAGQRWACIDGCHHGVVPGTTPLQVAYAVEGRAVLPNREAVAASLAPAVDEPIMRTRAVVVAFAMADPDAQRFVTPQVMYDALGEWREGRLVFDDARVTLLAFALTDRKIRDHVVTWTIRDWVDDVHTFWMALVRQIPAPFVAEPAVLLALTALVKGDGVLADAALHIAETSRPGHALVRLIRAMQESNLGPSQVRSTLERVTAT